MCIYDEFVESFNDVYGINIFFYVFFFFKYWLITSAKCHIHIVLRSEHLYVKRLDAMAPVILCNAI